MKFAFFCLALFLFPLFAYVSPPHGVVSGHNDELAPSLLDSGCINPGDPTYEDPITCAEFALLSAYPSVDSRISAGEQAFLLWRYAYAASSKSRTITGADGCIDYYHKTYQGANVSANISALFRNNTYYTADIAEENPVALPVPQNELNETQGDSITITLKGKIIFRYILDKTLSHLECDENGSCRCSETVYPSEPFNITRTAESNLIYEVEGGALLHFLNKPALREQWFKNSKFEDFVFSKRKFYSSGLLLNGSQIGTASLYEFSITDDSFDVWRVISHRTSNFSGLGATETQAFTIPIPIEENNDAFTSIYIFNSSYSALGPHNLTLVLIDHFGNVFSREFGITNRMLTFNGSRAEDGSTGISDRNYFRPSSASGEKNITLLVAGFGFFGVLALTLIFSRR